MKNKALPLFALAAGVLGAALRWLLYALTTDAKNLIPVGHPLAIVLWILTAAVVILVSAATIPLRNAENDPKRFRSNLLAGLGTLAAAVGIALTVLLNKNDISGTLGLIWKVLGIASAVSLAVVSLCRVRGKMPFFGLHTVVTIFFAIHLVTSYRTWSSNPQLMDYAFSLFAGLGMMLFAFYHACLEVGMAKLRLLPVMGLISAYLCTICLSGMENLPLYLGGILWTITNLFHLHTEN